MSPLAAIAAPAGDTTDAVKGESPIESTVVAGNQAVAKTAAQLAEESAKQFEAAKAAYDVAQKKADAAGQAQKQAQQQKDQASQAVTDNAAEQNATEVAALQEKIGELKAAVDKAEEQQKKLGDLNGQLDQAKKSVEDKTQALKDAEKKRDDAKKALDDAQDKLGDMGLGKYEAAKKDVEDAQAKLNAANADVKKAEGELAAARTAATNAEQAKSDAESALMSAQAKKQETANALAAATTARDNAQKKLDQAQAELDAATSGTGVDLKALEAAKVAAASELKTAKAELDAATTADATAQADLQTAQTAANAAQEKVNAANAAVSSARAAYDEANGKLGDLTSKYNTAKAAYEQAQQTEAEKKAAYEQAQKNRDDKYTECKAAYEAEDVAEKELGEANQLLGDLEGQIDALKSTMTVDQEKAKQGVIGLMDSIANDSSYTDAQRANARIASAWLSGNAADGINKADWFDQYVDNDGTHNTSSFSFEQLKNALTYMDTLNNIRKANGLGELSVSLKQTAAAVLQVNYSAHTGLHAQHYSNAENLSSTLDYAYTGGETIDTLGDPYTGWYTEEKRVWDEKVASDPSYEQYKTHAYLLYMSDPSFYSQVGHYLNIIHPDYVAMGFGVGNGKGDNVGACVINDFSFDSSDCDFSVADFKKLVNDYIDSAYGADVT